VYVQVDNDLNTTLESQRIVEQSLLTEHHSGFPHKRNQIWKERSDGLVVGLQNGRERSPSPESSSIRELWRHVDEEGDKHNCERKVSEGGGMNRIRVGLRLRLRFRLWLRIMLRCMFMFIVVYHKTPSHTDIHIINPDMLSAVTQTISKQKAIVPGRVVILVLASHFSIPRHGMSRDHNLKI
jgi:hypothetical protein